MALTLGDVESTRAAFAMWPGTVFRYAVCGEAHPAAEPREWWKCAYKPAEKWVREHEVDVPAPATGGGGAASDRRGVKG